MLESDWFLTSHIYSGALARQRSTMGKKVW